MATDGRDTGKWIILALCLVVAGSEVYVAGQNWQLRKRVTAADSVTKRMNFLRTQTERTLFEASMTGRCRPLFDTAATPAPRPLEVDIYFSLTRDCMSCVEDVVGQWNEALKNAPNTFTVRGFTDIDGTRAQTAIDRDVKPAFPITSIPDIEQKLAMAGINSTPVVFVSEPATGRILLTYAPIIGQRGDRSLVERVRNVLTPCK